MRELAHLKREVVRGLAPRMSERAQPTPGLVRALPLAVLERARTLMRKVTWAGRQPIQPEWR